MKLTSFFILPCLILCIFISSACQPTPKSPIVIEKGDLSEHIAQQAEPEIDGSRPGEARLQFEKTYDSGNSVIIDAPLLQPASSQAPVASVQAKPFVSGDGLEQMVRAFYPNATVYAHNMLTKTDIEKEIIFYKELLFREENGLDPVTGGPVAPGDEGPAMELSGDSEASTRDRLQATIEKYEEEYKIAPADSDLPQTDYVLKDMGSSYQLNLRAVDGSAIATIDFVNWEVGSNFYISLSEYDQSVSKFTATYQPPQELDENRAQELAMVQQCLESIGIDYMAPASANLGESCNAYYFVREVNGFPETYVKTYFGTQALGADGYPVMNLWTQEYVEAVVQAGKLVSLKWQNPSEIVQIDNENAKLLPWDTIEQRCKEQLDRMLTPATYSPSGEPTAIHINRIELGLTKLLMPNSKSYKLIPTWSFLGYDEAATSRADDAGAAICFVTINALDGSIVDRGNMY